MKNGNLKYLHRHLHKKEQRNAAEAVKTPEAKSAAEEVGSGKKKQKEAEGETSDA